MSSHPQIETPGSSVHARHPDSEHGAEKRALPLEDALRQPGESTDDTPTIISRHKPDADSKAPSMPEISLDSPHAGIRGRRLAHFELIEPIGVGGMAAVLRALDTQLDRFVALKILPPEMAADPENVRRFHQEARSAAKLDHENIARVFYCGEDQRLHFIAFEFVEGENLRHILERRGRLPVPEAIHYMLQIASGLSHASQRGVVHRDIKPSNIIITPTGRAKLVDMGLARSLEPRTDNDLTQSGVTLGTFDYISPEQALEPRDADIRSDIYSLGCTFYHVLTGRPPVPEGTAAKKLHHHQHVKPVDPREFVPDLPVEVVSILDRMMAKDPRERIQSPDQLVHQLLALARLLGTTPEVPEAVLTVETTVSKAPSRRPFLWTTIAAVAVIALVLALDQVPSPPLAPEPIPDKATTASENDGKGKTKPLPENGQEEPAPSKVRPADSTIARYVAQDGSTIEELMKWLEQQTAATLELRLAGELDLSPLQSQPSRGLVLRATKISIAPRDPNQRVTLKFRYDANTDVNEPFIALALEANETQIEGVRFVVDARGSPDILLTGLMLRGGRKHEVRNCEFLQAEPASLPVNPFSSLVVRADKARSEVLLRDCVFAGFGKVRPFTDLETGLIGMSLSEAQLGGQVAIVRHGPVALSVDQCAFGPHASIFRLTESSLSDMTPLQITNSSILLSPRRSSLFELATGASGKVVVTNCLISRAKGETEEGAVLIRQEEERTGRLVYQGRDNCYHDLDGYWVQRDWMKASWTDFRNRLTGDNRDESARLLTCSPWEADADRQQMLLEEERFNEAFRLNLRLAALRRPGRGSDEEVVGAVRILNSSWLPTTLPRVETSQPRFLVVEPSEDSVPGVFKSLVDAINNARDRDTILLRHNDEVEVDPIALSNKGLNELTIKPARKFRPILALADVSDTDSAFFRVYNGKLTLDGLEFRLRTGRRDYRTRTLVSLVGDGECALKDCVVTMTQRSLDTTMALATVVESGKAMKTDMLGGRTSDQGPRLLLEGCFIRGEADLLWTRANRPFALDVRESLVALSGSVVNLDLSAEDTTPPSSREIRLSFDRVTTYLAGHLVRLSSTRDARGLLPVRCRAEYCLFLPAGSSKTLIQLEGVEGDEKSLNDKFLSKDWRQNAYGSYASLMSQESTDGMAAPVGMDKWRTRSGDDTGTFNVKLERPPSSVVPFSKIEASQLKPPESIRDAGVQIRLPRPAASN